MSTIRCNGGCDRGLPGSEFFTEINPEGGHGRPRVLVCDDCMRSGRWDGWIKRKWPNWPNLPKEPGTVDE